MKSFRMIREFLNMDLVDFAMYFPVCFLGALLAYYVFGPAIVDLIGRMIHKV